MDWKERAIEEKEQLDDRLKKLISFQSTGVFASLPVEQIKWLNRQRMVMELYSDILADRLALVWQGNGVCRSNPAYAQR